MQRVEPFAGAAGGNYGRKPENFSSPRGGGRDAFRKGREDHARPSSF